MRVKMAKNRCKSHEESASTTHRNPNLLSHYHECASRVFYNGGRANEYLHNLFLKAAKNGEIERIRNFLKRSSRTNNVNVDYKDKKTGNTAICLAALGNHAEVVQLLLNYGADITLHNEQGQSVIELAPETIQHILLASVERQGISHRHLLQAAWQGNVDVLKRLLSSQADLNVNCKNADGMTPLLLVTRDVDLFEKIERKVTERGYHPLEVLKELLYHKANTSVKSSDGRSPLHYIANNKGKTAEDMANVIIEEQDSCLELQDGFNCFPIHIASREDNYPVLLALINNGADVNVKGYNGQTPLHMSAAQGHERCSSALIDSGADVTLVDDYGYSPVDITTSKQVHRVLKEAWVQQTKNNSKNMRMRRSLSAPSQDHSKITSVQEKQAQITSSKEKTLSPRKSSSKQLSSTNINSSNSGQGSQTQHKIDKPLVRSNSLTVKPSPPRPSRKNDIFRQQTRQISSRSQETAIFNQERLELPKLSVKNIELQYTSSLQPDFPSITNIQRMRLLTPGHSRSLPGTPCSFSAYHSSSARRNIELSLHRRSRIPARIAPLPGSATPDNTQRLDSSLGCSGQVVDLDLLQNGSSYLTGLARLAISADVVDLKSPPQPPSSPSDLSKSDDKEINNRGKQSPTSRNELHLASFDEADSDDDIENENVDGREVSKTETSPQYQTQTFSLSEIKGFWIPNVKDNENHDAAEITTNGTDKEQRTLEKQEEATRQRTSSMSSCSFYVNLNDVTSNEQCVSCGNHLDSTSESNMCSACEHAQKSHSQHKKFWISIDGETSDGEAETPNDTKKIRYSKVKSTCTMTRKTKSLPATYQPSIGFHVAQQPNDLDSGDSERNFNKESKCNDNGELKVQPREQNIDNNSVHSNPQLESICDNVSENRHVTSQSEKQFNDRNGDLNSEEQSDDKNIMGLQSENTFVIGSNVDTANEQSIHEPNNDDHTTDSSCTIPDNINDPERKQKTCPDSSELIDCDADPGQFNDNKQDVHNSIINISVNDTNNTSKLDNDSVNKLITGKDNTLVNHDTTSPVLDREDLSKESNMVCQSDDKSAANETHYKETIPIIDALGVDGPKTAWSKSDGVQICNAFPSPVPPSCTKPEVQPPIGEKTAKRKTSGKKAKKGSSVDTKKCTQTRNKSVKEQVKKGKKKGKKKDQSFKEINVNQSSAHVAYMPGPGPQSSDVSISVPSPDVDNVPTLSIDSRTFSSKVLMRNFPVLSPIPESPYSNTSTPRSIDIHTNNIVACTEASNINSVINSDIIISKGEPIPDVSAQESRDTDTTSNDKNVEGTDDSELQSNSISVHEQPGGDDDDDVYDEVDGGLMSRLFGVCIPRLHVSNNDSDQEDLINSNDDNQDDDDDKHDDDDDNQDDDDDKHDDDDSFETDQKKGVVDQNDDSEINDDVEDMLQEILQNTDDMVMAEQLKSTQNSSQRNKFADSDNDDDDDSDDNDRLGEMINLGSTGTKAQIEGLHKQRNKSIKHQRTMNYINQMSHVSQGSQSEEGSVSQGSQSEEGLVEQEHEKSIYPSSDAVFMDDVFSDNDSSYISCDSTPRCVSDCSTFESNDSVLSPQHSRGSTLTQDTPHDMPHESVDITSHEQNYKTSQSSSSDSRSTISNNSILSTQSFFAVNSRPFVRSQVSLHSVSSATSCGEEIQWQKGSILGKGGFGTVWLGLVNTGEMIAVKQVELSHNDDTEAEKQYEKLQEEVSLLKSLRHENIVRYIGTCLDENFVVNIFMEYVPGGSIAQALKRFGAFVEPVFRRYTKQILCGVEYLHVNNVIHRDIKGGNIMLMPNGVIKLIDFGCAKRLCMNLSLSRSSMLHSIKGTPYWMAPEVIKETGAGTKSDIWSIGCTVFEMATGSPPWSEMQPMAAIFSIGSGSIVPRLDEPFSQLARDFTTTCMTREPDARPSASELLQHKFLNE